MDAMIEVLNTSIGVEESGLQFISENDAVTIASTNGLARLSPRIVGSLLENRTELVEDSSVEFSKSLWLVLNRMVRTSPTLADGDVDGILVEDGVCGIGVRLDLDLKPMPLRGHGVFQVAKSSTMSPSMADMVLLRMAMASCMETSRMMKKQSISLTIRKWLQFHPHQANGLPYKVAMLRAYGQVM